MAAILPFRRAARPPGPLLLSPPHLTGAEAGAFQDLLDSGWLAPAGPTLARFEAEVARVAGFGGALATASATAALSLAFRVLGIGPGDEVWTSTLTFVATVAPAVQLGATPRFLDVAPGCWTLDPALLEAELAAAARRGRLPRCVVSVDLYGQPADIPALHRACDAWGVPLVSDSACALGARQHGNPAGQGARLAVLSFNGNKIVTAGGGGALLADDAALLARARHLATQAREPAAHYEHRELGGNLVMSAVLAAVGLAQLPALEERVAARRRLFARYRAALPHLAFQGEPAWARSSRWLSVLLTDAAQGPGREALREALAAAGIESRPAWKPMHLQPAFRDAPFAGGAVATDVFARGLCLPSGSAMTEADADRVVATILGCGTP